jgi:hypothetical protein
MDYKIEIKGNSLPLLLKYKAISAATEILCQEFGDEITEGMSFGTVRIDHSRVGNFKEICLSHLYNVILKAKLISTA